MHLVYNVNTADFYLVDNSDIRSKFLFKNRKIARYIYASDDDINENYITAYLLISCRDFHEIPFIAFLSVLSILLSRPISIYIFKCVYISHNKKIVSEILLA